MVIKRRVRDALYGAPQVRETSSPLIDLDHAMRLQTPAGVEKYPAKQHARNVARTLKAEKGLFYLASEKTILMRDSDQPVPFRQRRFFYYLTGCNEPDTHVTYDVAQDLLTLFIPKIDLRHAVWGGAGSTKAEAYAKYDVDVVEYTSELPKAVRQWSSLRSDQRLYLVDSTEEHRDLLGPILISLSQGAIDTNELKSAIELCRAVKDPYEIALLRRANDISAAAHTAVLRHMREYTNERQIEGIFLDTCISSGAHNQAYSIIAGAGSNAAILHYGKNDAPLDGKQVVLLDAGAEYQCYASDVTRTFPILGFWSKEGKAIYDAVNDMQAQCINRIKPGIHFHDLQLLATAIATKHLLDLGVLHNGSVEEIIKAGTIFAFFPHGLGHHVGLEVHDVSHVPVQLPNSVTQPTRNTKMFKNTALDGCSPATLDSLYRAISTVPLIAPATLNSPVLEPGMVVTVEPGLYFSQYALSNVYLQDPKHERYINKAVLVRFMAVGGVRIEDDILVTSTGFENLTLAPKGDDALKIIRGEDTEVAATKTCGGIEEGRPKSFQDTTRDLCGKRTSIAAQDVLPPSRGPSLMQEFSVKRDDQAHVCQQKHRYKFSEFRDRWTDDESRARAMPNSKSQTPVGRPEAVAVHRPGRSKAYRVDPGAPASTIREPLVGQGSLSCCYVRALYDYDDSEAGHLKVKKGDLIQIIDLLETGWCDGWCNGKRGWMPVNYIEVVPSEELVELKPDMRIVPPSIEALKKAISFASSCMPDEPETKSFFAKALYDCNNDDNDITCLSFKKDDVLLILVCEEAGGGEWWDAYLHGKRGWVPSNHLKRVSPDETTITM